MISSIPTPRKQLSSDALIASIRKHCESIGHRGGSGTTIPLADALMAGFALFSLKDPSLLAFDQRRLTDEDNLKRLYHIDRVPADTTLREILDPVDEESMRPAFKMVFGELQRQNVLASFRVLGDYYVLAIDGTEYFNSKTIHCEHCLQKQHRDGSTTYHHQMLGASIVCPGRPEVIPLMPEPILKQDGDNKNDFERNAFQRFFPKFRIDHPHLRTIAVLDALYANAPVIADLRAAHVRWMIRVKAEGSAFLFERVRELSDRGETEVFQSTGANGELRLYEIAKNVPLNASNPDVRVDFLSVREPLGNDRWYTAAWIVDPLLRLDPGIAAECEQVGRSRWKVENETFNTLKNQGYHFEHNFGHGHQNLSVVLMVLLMLAFLVDQTAQICCQLFTAALAACHSKRALWERQREINHQFQVRSFAEIYAAILRGNKPTLGTAWDP